MSTDPFWESNRPSSAGAPAFKFQSIGDGVAGVITQRDAVTQSDDNGNPKTTVVLTLTTTEGEEVAVWCSNVDLVTKMYEQKPTIGDTVAIRYVADEDIGRPSPMKIYEVAVKRQPVMGSEAPPAGQPSAADLLPS